MQKETKHTLKGLAISSCATLICWLFTLIPLPEEETPSFKEAAKIEPVFLVEKPVIPHIDSPEEMQAILSEVAPVDGISYSSTYEPSDTALAIVNQAAEKLHSEGYHVSGAVMDLLTGRTLMYNPDEEYYSASTIKGFFVASLADNRPDLLDTYMAGVMENAVMNSSNEAYLSMWNTYLGTYLQGWFENAGVDGSKAWDGYPYYSARDMAKLWAENYWWFATNENGQRVAPFYQSPNRSAIRTVIADAITTRSKAGWICYIDSTGVLSATHDGEIVYDGDHPYLLVVMSDVPEEFDQIIDMTRSLVYVHEDMIQDLEEYSESR